MIPVVLILHFACGPFQVDKFVATKITTRPQTLMWHAQVVGKRLQKGKNMQWQDHSEDDIFKVQDDDIVKTFYKYENCMRLTKSIKFWKQSNVSDFILNVIIDVYENLLRHEPEEIFLRNKSTLDKSEFVSTAI